MNEKELRVPYSPWDDPNVKEALAHGRGPDDIMLFDCPTCLVHGFYNEGSHWTCRNCGETFDVMIEGEEPPANERAIVYVEEAIALEDWYQDDAP